MTNYFLKAYKKVNILNRKIKETFSILLFKELAFNPLLISFLINIFLYLLLFLITTPVYRSNDDIISNLTSAGFFGKENTEFLIFGNIIFGKLLKLFYDMSSQYNWYLLFLLFTQILSHILILYYLLKVCKKYISLFVYICLFSIYSINLFTEISFSGTSLIALSGSLLILYYILQKKGREVSGYFWFFILLLISLIIRKDTFLIFCYLFFIFPILFIRKWKDLLLILSFSIICNISLNALNKYFYEKVDPLQLEYQKARVLFQDRNLYLTETELEKTGWSNEDYNMYAGFKGIDNLFYNKKSVINNSKIVSYKLDFRRILLSPYSLSLYFIGDIYYYSLGFIFLFFQFFHLRRTRKFLFSIISVWVLLFFILGIIAVHYRLYIYYTILFYLCLVGAFLVLQKTNLLYCQSLLRKSGTYVIIILLFTVSISLVRIIHNNKKIKNLNYPNFNIKVDELKSSNKRFLIIGDESEYIFGKLSIFQTYNNNIEVRLKELLIPIGWFINTIQFDRIVNGSVMHLLMDGDIYILGTDKDFFNSIKKFINVHYNLQVDFLELDDYKFSKAYKLISIDNVK